MAFRRKRAKTRRSPLRRKTSSTRRTRRKGGSSIKILQFDSMLYGAVRSKIAQLISPLTAKLPMGQYADEVGCGIIDYFVAKKSTGMIKEAAKKGLSFENTMVGFALGQQFLGGMNKTSTSKGITII